MNVLSLFDGMSGGQISFQKAGVNISNYYASEVCKNAIKTTIENFPNTIHVGDVTRWREWVIDWGSIDYLIGGSPCQGFSYAGKQLAFNDPRSSLFFVYVDILNHTRKHNPKIKFLLENVKMKQEFLSVITEHVGVDPVLINSNTITPCSRPRYYWANWKIGQPERRERVFGDVIDYSSEENTMSDSWHAWWEKNKEFQLAKQYSKIVGSSEQGMAMTTRQYSNWNGNFIQTPSGKIRKPTRTELALLVGAPKDYFKSTSQRQAEIMTGNGWSIDVIVHIIQESLEC